MRMISRLGWHTNGLLSRSRLMRPRSVRERAKDRKDYDCEYKPENYRQTSTDKSGECRKGQHQDNDNQQEVHDTASPRITDASVILGEVSDLSMKASAKLKKSSAFLK
jgi:hypothetical protein